MTTDFERRASTRAYRAVTQTVAGILGIVAPGAAAHYVQGRNRLLGMHRRGYVAGKTDGPNQGFRPSNKSADAEYLRDSKLLLARARDLVRNYPNIAGAVKRITQNVVYTGSWPQVRFAGSDGKRDKVKSRELEALWHAWAARADATGYGSVYSLQSLALRHLIIDGGLLVHATMDNTDADGLPLRLSLYEYDQLDEYKDGESEGGNLIRRGVEMDAVGRQVAYHVLHEHPGESIHLGNVRWRESRRIKASACRNVFLRERIGQSRGVSWLASVIMRAFDLDEYQDYEMIGAKLAAAFGVFITSGASSDFDNDPTTAKSAAGQALEYIEPGRLQRLAPGEKIEIAEHKRPGDSYAPFVRSKGLEISAGMGMSYENFSNDYSGSSYSSARQAILEERRGYRCIQNFLDEQFNLSIWRAFVRSVTLSGAFRLPAGYAVERADQFVRFVRPGWEWIDPVKDATGAKTRVELGISSRTREAAAAGADIEEIVEEQELEQELMKNVQPQQPTVDAAGKTAA